MRTHSLERTAIVVLILAVALLVRLHGLTAEPFWRDEIYSRAFSDADVIEVLEETARDVHPPLYYLGLHVWRHLFDDSIAVMRSYSAVWSLVGLFAVFLLARDLAGWRAGAIALALGALSAFDVYAAQEARMYSQAIALCTLATWCLWRWVAVSAEDSRSARWVGWAVAYSLAGAGALCTQALSVIVLVAQGLFVLAWLGWRRRWTCVLGYAAATVVVALAFLPWLIYVRQVRGSLYNPALGWLTAPPLVDYVSFLGREFSWGQARSFHGQWWIPTMVLPVFVLAVCLWRLWREPCFDAPGPEALRRVRIVYPLWLLIVPIVLAALVVQLYKPIYFRPRFSQFVFMPSLVLAGIACDSFRSRVAVGLATTVLFAAVAAGTYVQQTTYQRVFWTRFDRAWRDQGPPAHVVFFPHDLERDGRRHLGRSLPVASREELESRLAQLDGQRIWVCPMIGYDFDRRPREYDDYDWLLGLGSVRNIVISTGFRLLSVGVGERSVEGIYGGRLNRWYGPVGIPGRVEGLEDSSRFHLLEFEGSDRVPFRWSKPRAWFALSDSDRISTVVLQVGLPARIRSDYRPQLRVYLKRSSDAAGLFATSPVLRIDDYRAGLFEIELAAPPGTGPIQVGWTLNGVNLERAGISGDSRDLGLVLRWIGLQTAPR